MADSLVPIDIDSILIGKALPFPIRNEGGVLLANKGFVVSSRQELELMLGRGVSFYIDASDSEAYHRAYLGQLYSAVGQNKSLGQIASVTASVSGPTSRRPVDRDPAPVDWLDLQSQGHTLLREPGSPHFSERLGNLLSQLQGHVQQNPDGCLFALFHLASSETQMYSATHAMLVCVMCSLASRGVLGWPEQVDETLCLAALTMNIGMTELQDRLAVQTYAVTPEQRKHIDHHPALSVALLEKAGITNAVLLEAVLNHHSVTPGPLASKTPGLRMARLIQRADMFAARLSPRAKRAPLTPAAAMQASYFDENRQVDEAGAALIKAVGVHSPGAFVRLATNEVAVVLRRGTNPLMPRVAVLVNREGLPTAEPILRDTSLRDYRITSSVSRQDVKVQLNLQRLIPLTSA
ncbi:MAG: hypothetical protein OEY75_05560 [Hylemonella sp.]|nr:hypothetical protein [Hylemonella sp.]MDH5708561.1 hypothetical protein [Hylemonella sp.]